MAYGPKFRNWLDRKREKNNTGRRKRGEKKVEGNAGSRGICHVLLRTSTANGGVKGGIRLKRGEWRKKARRIGLSHWIGHTKKKKKVGGGGGGGCVPSWMAKTSGD